MSFARSMEAPITGREALGEIIQPVPALARFYRVVGGRDLVGLAPNWEASECVAMGTEGFVRSNLRQSRLLPPR